MSKTNRANNGNVATANANAAVDDETGEVVATNLPGDNTETDTASAMNRRNRTGKLASGVKFKKVKSVTVPVVKLMPDRPVYLRFESKLERSKQVMQKKVGDKPMEPATIAHCLNLENDSECILIVGKMLESVLRESYPDDSYVSKSFELVNHGMRGDKRYNSYSVNEVELEE